MNAALDLPPHDFSKDLKSMYGLSPTLHLCCLGVLEGVNGSHHTIKQRDNSEFCSHHSSNDVKNSSACNLKYKENQPCS